MCANFYGLVSLGLFSRISDGHSYLFYPRIYPQSRALSWKVTCSGLQCEGTLIANTINRNEREPGTNEDPFKRHVVVIFVLTECRCFISSCRKTPSPPLIKEPEKLTPAKGSLGKLSRSSKDLKRYELSLGDCGVANEWSRVRGHE